ncbi:MAG: hypothetical protein LBN22_03565 [Clostridiales Family XIII bacterium]|jgi:hypothetical protein|nr:hypothetical protein [Clostridiales Family XIII bacterium]
MAKKKSKLYDIAKQMPPMIHTIQGCDFDIKNSDVVKWLCQQPEIMQQIFNNVKGCEIVYDSETQMWRGVDYEN